jgi:hypothetical protein
MPMQNYTLEIAKILSDSPEMRADYERICKVASAVAQTEEDFLPYVWAYLTGKSDWKSMEKIIP